MEGSTTNSSQFVRAPAEGKGKNMKFWSGAEEAALVIAVKELIVDGWKAGNGWRPGFFGQVEKKIKKMIPTSNVRGEPHVLSKITVWKRQYYLLRGVLGASGKERLDPVDFTITSLGTEKWETGVKLNPELEKLRNKSFPYYFDWCDMFGVDRANGEGAHDVGSSVQQILRNEMLANRANATANQQNTAGNDEDDDAFSGARTPAQSMTFHTNTSKKRKEKSILDEESFTQMMGTYMNDTKDALIDLSKAIRSLKEVDPAVSTVFAELEKLPEFSTDQRVVAVNRICANPTHGI